MSHVAVWIAVASEPSGVLPAWWFDVARHPVTLVILTAVVGGIVVPYITNRGQRHQRELELKAGLVTECTNAVVTMVYEIQFVRSRRELGLTARPKDEIYAAQRRFDDAYRDWEVAAASTEAKLRAYFDESVVRSWTHLATAVTRFYALEGTAHDQQEALLAELAADLSARSTERPASRWGDVRRAIFDALTAFTQQLLKASPGGSGTRGPRRSKLSPTREETR